MNYSNRFTSDRILFCSYLALTYGTLYTPSKCWCGPVETSWQGCQLKYSTTKKQFPHVLHNEMSSFRLNNHDFRLPENKQVCQSLKITFCVYHVKNTPWFLECFGSLAPGVCMLTRHLTSRVTLALRASWANQSPLQNCQHIRQFKSRLDDNYPGIKPSYNRIVTIWPSSSEKISFESFSLLER